MGCFFHDQVVLISDYRPASWLCKHFFGLFFKPGAARHCPEEPRGAHPPRVPARPPRPSSPQVHGITKITSLVESSSALSRSQTGAPGAGLRCALPSRGAAQFLARNGSKAGGGGPRGARGWFKKKRRVQRRHTTNTATPAEAPSSQWAGSTYRNPAR